MCLHVEKSSLIDYNCLGLFTVKGQVGRTVHKSLTEAHQLRPKAGAAHLTAGEIPRQVQGMSVSRAPVATRQPWLHQSSLQRGTRESIRTAHRSLLLRLTACQARPYFIHFSHLTICETDKVVIPAQGGNRSVENLDSSRAVVVNRGQCLGHFSLSQLGGGECRWHVVAGGPGQLLNILPCTEQPPLHQQRIIRTQMSIALRLREFVPNQEQERPRVPEGPLPPEGFGSPTHLASSGAAVLPSALTFLHLVELPLRGPARRVRTLCLFDAGIVPGTQGPGNTC